MNSACLEEEEHNKITVIFRLRSFHGKCNVSRSDFPKKIIYKYRDGLYQKKHKYRDDRHLYIISKIGSSGVLIVVYKDDFFLVVFN